MLTPPEERDTVLIIVKYDQFKVYQKSTGRTDVVQCEPRGKILSLLT